MAGAALLLLVLAAASPAQTPPAELDKHIASLSSLDFPTRMNAARMIRRAPAAEAVPALSEAVLRHRDEFVRYRALIVLSSFNDRRTRELVGSLLRDRNDRLREVAYKWLERNPDPALAETLRAALETEQAEFVRPALVGALAAVDDSPLVQRALINEVTRGFDFFRSAVIDALGRHQAAYAVDAIAAVARLDGPLQDDALIALGRIGGARALAAIMAVPDDDPQVSVNLLAARCLAGESCAAAVSAAEQSAGAAQATVGSVRNAVAALAALAAANRDGATAALLRLAETSAPLRREAAIGLAIAAVRDPSVMLAWLGRAPAATLAAAVDLLEDGFEDLEEDFGEEQFFAETRAAYWAASENSPTRALAASLIQRLDF